MKSLIHYRYRVSVTSLKLAMIEIIGKGLVNTPGGVKKKC